MSKKRLMFTIKAKDYEKLVKEADEKQVSIAELTTEKINKKIIKSCEIILKKSSN